MHVCFNGNRIAIGRLKMRRHPGCHDERRMKSNHHIHRIAPGKSLGFGV